MTPRWSPRRTPEVVVSTDLAVDGVHFRTDWATGEQIGRAGGPGRDGGHRRDGRRSHRTGGRAQRTGQHQGRVGHGHRRRHQRGGRGGRGRRGRRRRDPRRSAHPGGDRARRPAWRAPVLRSGARPGDVVAVCGRLGWAAAGLAVLSRGFRSPAVVVGAYRVPEPPLAAGPVAAASGATSMIDVSDGLLADLGHIAQASGVAIDVKSVALQINPRLVEVASALGKNPLEWVLTGGDDHALVATFPQGSEHAARMGADRYRRRAGRGRGPPGDRRRCGAGPDRRLGPLPLGSPRPPPGSGGRVPRDHHAGHARLGYRFPPCRVRSPRSWIRGGPRRWSRWRRTSPRWGSSCGPRSPPVAATCRPANTCCGPSNGRSTDVRVLIVGQDPYPTPGHPIGLVVRRRRPRPAHPAVAGQHLPRAVDRHWASLPPEHGDLSGWADAGVLLLNRCLTVAPGRSAAHRGKGWEPVTDRAIAALVERGGPLVAILWGRDAQNAAAGSRRRPGDRLGTSVAVVGQQRASSGPARSPGPTSRWSRRAPSPSTGPSRTDATPRLTPDTGGCGGRTYPGPVTSTRPPAPDGARTALHISHWGAFEADTDGERITAVRPYAADPDPRRVIDNVVDAHRHSGPDRPAVRQGRLAGRRPRADRVARS